MTVEELTQERDKIVQEFTDAMSAWLEAFNERTDAMIENSERTEKILKEIRDGR